MVHRTIDSAVGDDSRLAADDMDEALVAFDRQLTGELAAWPDDAIAAPALEERLAFLRLVEQVWPRRQDDERPTVAETPWRQLGRFHLVRELGRGGCGVVFLAEDPFVERRVALKIPRPEALVSDELQERFLREARAAAALAHPNIVGVYEAGQAGAVAYIAAAYCEGPNLTEWLRGQTAPVDARIAARLIAQLADAVQHAHSRGVLHRDIKPGNVLFDSADGAAARDSSRQLPGVPKLTDFGLAKLLAETGTATRTGSLVGTPAYMAPEQAEGQLDRIGPATDVYALGAVLYEVLACRPPLVGESDPATLRLVVDAEAVSLRRLSPHVPRDLEAIVHKCLEKDPARRYGSAAALRDDLERFVAGRPVEARSVGTAMRAARWCRRRPVLAASWAALAAAILGGLAGISWQWRRAEAHLAQSERQRQRAEHQFVHAQRLIKEMLAVADDGASHHPASAEVARDLRRRAVEYYASALVETGPRLGSYARELANAYASYAHRLNQIDQFEQAMPVAAEAVRRWQVEFERRPDFEARGGLANACLVAHRSTQIVAGAAAALRSLDRAAAALGELASDAPLFLRQTRADLWRYRGRCLQAGGQPQAALAAYAEAFADSSALLAGDSDNRSMIEELAITAIYAARLSLVQGVCVEAEHYLAVAVRACDAWLGRHPADLALRTRLVELQACYRDTQRRLGNHRDAAQWACTALENGVTVVRAAGTQPDESISAVVRWASAGLSAIMAVEGTDEYRARLAAAVGTLHTLAEDPSGAVGPSTRVKALVALFVADLAMAQGDQRAASEHFARATQHFEDLAARQTLDNRDARAYARCLFWRGRVEFDAGQEEQACASLLTAIGAATEALARHDDLETRGYLARAHFWRARFLRFADPAQAAQHYRQASEQYAAVLAVAPHESGFARDREECLAFLAN
ncbi:MAG: serine/threonine protein kinase [Pirellulales bacterium]|nr:serine/threonine protein kinase [Pirellulales bacterium]